MRPVGTHFFPTMDRVIFGRPAAQALRDEVERLQKRNVFLMVSHTLKSTTDEIEKVKAVLGERFVGLFDQVPQHTSRRSATAAAQAAVAAKADLIVAIGGGSVVDASKIMLVCMEHKIFEPEGLDGFEFKFGPDGTPQRPTYRPPSVRMIAIPSTLSGGEYNAGCVVTDTDRMLKQTFFHPFMMPVTIILDPELSLHAPETLWVGSGTRAMDHAIEALCATNGSPLVDASVLRGLGLMAKMLPQSRANPTDVGIRAQCQIASWLCSFGLQARVPMGASHAIGHVLGGTCGVPHFLCTPVMMPAVLHYNEPETKESQKEVAIALGRPGVRASDAFRQFVRDLGLPTQLSEVGVTKDKFEMISRTTMKEEMFIYTNPRPVAKWEHVRDILTLAA